MKTINKLLAMLIIAGSVSCSFLALNEVSSEDDLLADLLMAAPVNPFSGATPRNPNTPIIQF